jgi:hypothetical protein
MCTIVCGSMHNVPVKRLALGWLYEDPEAVEVALLEVSNWWGEDGIMTARRLLVEAETCEAERECDRPPYYLDADTEDSRAGPPVTA